MSADSDGFTKVWDVRMVKEEMSFDSGMTSANCAVFDKSCNLVFVASEDASIKIFNTQTREKETDTRSIRASGATTWVVEEVNEINT